MAMTFSGTGGITFPDSTTQASGASTAYGGIGSYVIAATNSGGVTAGATVAGSSLVYQNYENTTMNMGYIPYYEGQLLAGNIWTGSTSLGLSGTWRAMTKTISANKMSLYVRIS
jgi:hypothetical protein